MVRSQYVYPVKFTAYKFKKRYAPHEVELWAGKPPAPTANNQRPKLDAEQKQRKLKLQPHELAPTTVRSFHAESTARRGAAPPPPATAGKKKRAPKAPAANQLPVAPRAKRSAPVPARFRQ